jgi:hypothetical protein
VRNTAQHIHKNKKRNSIITILSFALKFAPKACVSRQKSGIVNDIIFSSKFIKSIAIEWFAFNHKNIYVSAKKYKF